MHLRVATEPMGGHADRLDHGAPAANHGSLRIEPWPPAGKDRDISRGAADIRDDRIPKTAQPSRANDAGGGTRKDRLDRPDPGEVGRDQGPVAAHDH